MKQTLIKRHVATKIFVLLLSGYLIVTIILTSLYIINQYDEIKQKGFNNQQMLLMALAPSLGQVTFDGDLDHIESLLKGIIKSPSIEGIAYSDITNTMNIKIGSIPENNLIDYQNNDNKDKYNNINEFEEGSLFGLYGNIIYNNRIVGNIIISSSQAVIFSEIKSVILIITIALLIQTLFLWIFFRWVSMVYLHRRLTDITNGLNNLETVTNKFIPLSVDTKEEDEISAIQKSFNSMAKKLQTTHNQLKEYNEELEEKVQKRTAELEMISITDRLTGLYNRHKIDSVLENEFRRSDRFSNSFSLILIDIDDFKSVNDSFGHQIGDKVLVEMAKLILSCIRSIDIIGRWGGEEFLVIAPQTDTKGALLLAENIRIKAEKHSFSEVGSKTLSLGISTFKQGYTIKELIYKADLALYASKSNGKNQVKYKE
jgi:diguanylate cyclase (GGDEF)-like protein